MSGPVNNWVCSIEPRESKYNVLSATTHNIEEMFLGNLFNIHLESTSVVNGISFVRSLVYVVNSDQGGKLFHREVMFSDKLLVNVGDISTRVYQCGGVDNFQSVRGGDQLYWDMHRFV